MPRKLILNPKQTIDYYTMYALESNCHQACHIELHLKKHDLNFTTKQISGSLQRLRKQDLVSYDGCWTLTNQNKGEK